MMNAMLTSAGLVMILAALAVFARGPARMRHVMEQAGEDPYHAAWILTVAIIVNLGTVLLFLAVAIA